MVRRGIALLCLVAAFGSPGFAGELPASAANSGSKTKTFIDIIMNGIEINSILGVLAFAALFILFLSLLSMRRKLVAPDSLRQQLLDDIASGDLEVAQKRAADSDTLLGQVVLPGLKQHAKSLERIHLVVENAGRRVSSSLRKRATYLANIGAICPMLGLLGTVMGMMNAFNAMGESQREGAKSLVMTAYIGQAMSTTAVGLMVGIPAMAFYYLCLSRAGRVADLIEEAAEEIVDAIGDMK